MVNTDIETEGNILNVSIKFGTDGWRAVMAREFTFDNVAVVAQAISNYVKSRNGW
jgi:Phosphomannomutase